MRWWIASLESDCAFSGFKSSLSEATSKPPETATVPEAAKSLQRSSVKARSKWIFVHQLTTSPRFKISIANSFNTAGGAASSTNETRIGLFVLSMFPYGQQALGWCFLVAFDIIQSHITKTTSLPVPTYEPKSFYSNDHHSTIDDRLQFL